MPCASGQIPALGHPPAKAVRSARSVPARSVPVSFKFHQGAVALSQGGSQLFSISTRLRNSCGRVSAMTSSTPATGSTDLFRGAMPKTEIGALEFLEVVSAGSEIYHFHSCSFLFPCTCRRTQHMTGVGLSLLYLTQALTLAPKACKQPLTANQR